MDAAAAQVRADRGHIMAASERLLALADRWEQQVVDAGKKADARDKALVGEVRLLCPACAAPAAAFLPFVVVRCFFLFFCFFVFAFRFLFFLPAFITVREGRRQHLRLIMIDIHYVRVVERGRSGGGGRNDDI